MATDAIAVVEASALKRDRGALPPETACGST